MRWLWVLLLGAAPVWAAPPKTPSPPTVAEFRVQSTAITNLLIRVNQSAGDQFYHDGAWEKSIDAWNRLIVLDPTNLDNYANAALLLFSLKKDQEAAAMRQRMVAALPKNPEAYFEVGLYYFNKRNDTEALRWFKQAVDLGLPSPKRHMYGHTLTHLGQHDAALAFWQLVLKEEPTDDVAQHEIEKLTGVKPVVATPVPTPETTEVATDTASK